MYSYYKQINYLYRSLKLQIYKNAKDNIEKSTKISLNKSNWPA